MSPNTKLAVFLLLVLIQIASTAAVLLLTRAR